MIIYSNDKICKHFFFRLCALPYNPPVWNSHFPMSGRFPKGLGINVYYNSFTQLWNNDRTTKSITPKCSFTQMTKYTNIFFQIICFTLESSRFEFTFSNVGQISQRVRNICVHSFEASIGNRFVRRETKPQRSTKDGILCFKLSFNPLRFFFSKERNWQKNNQRQKLSLFFLNLQIYLTLGN